MNSNDPYYYYMPPVLRDYCESSDHATRNCPYCAYVDATCACIENTVNDMTDRIIETMKERITKYSHCFNRGRENCSEHDSNLGSPKSDVSLYDDFDPSYLVWPD